MGKKSLYTRIPNAWWTCEACPTSLSHHYQQKPRIINRGKILDRQTLRSLVIPDVDEGAEQQGLSGGRGSDSKPSQRSLAASTEHKKPDPWTAVPLQVLVLGTDNTRTNPMMKAAWFVMVAK